MEMCIQIKLATESNHLKAGIPSKVIFAQATHVKVTT